MDCNEKDLKLVVKTAKQFASPGGNSPWMYIDGDGLPRDQGSHACCAGLKVTDKDRGFFFWTCGPKIRAEGTREFVEFMTNPQETMFGDHAEWLCPTEPLVIDGVDLRSLDFKDKYGLFWQKSQLDHIPANVFVNFLKMYRMPGEHPSRIRHWHKMVQAGVEKRDAFYWASHVYGNDTELNFQGPGHNWSNANSSTEYVRSRLVHRKTQASRYNIMTGLGGSYHYPHNCDGIWENNRQGKEFYAFTQEVAKKMPKFSKIPNHPFTGKPAEAMKGINLDDLIKVIPTIPLIDPKEFAQ